MENASKALLFAAGILIAIILISVAVYIVSISQDATKGVAQTVSDMDLASFNSKFSTYQGVVTGSQVKSLVSVVNSSNANNEGMDLIVEFASDIPTTIIDGSAEDGYVFKGGAAKKYSVDVESGKSGGAVKTINVTLKN